MTGEGKKKKKKQSPLSAGWGLGVGEWVRSALEGSVLLVVDIDVYMLGCEGYFF